MSMAERDDTIRIIEQLLYSKLITYVTSDRQGLQAQIGSDAIQRFRRHLESIGEVESITLFIYSRGGDTNVPWRLTALIREYCREFVVLVPFRAHSAATMICLGANRIIMGKMGELSSIDPSVANPFNPPDPVNSLARVPISVEDVNAYKALAKRFGADEDPGVSAQVFLALASKVNPLALGNVERSYTQIRKLAGDLLSLHRPDSERGEIDKIVATLTEKLYSHSHLINRREAKEIGLNVEFSDNNLDATMWNLYMDYAQEMDLERPFNALQALGQQQNAGVSLKRAFVESHGMTDLFATEGTISRPAPGAINLPPGIQIPPGLQAQGMAALQVDFEGWKSIR